MSIEKLITINGTDVSKIVEYKVSFCKLWSKDTGRSMTGENKGTLIAIFPKLELKIGSMDGDSMASFLSLVNRAHATVEYYDPEWKEMVSNSFYFGDVSADLKRQSIGNYKSFSVSIIANKRRI